MAGALAAQHIRRLARAAAPRWLPRQPPLGQRRIAGGARQMSSYSPNSDAVRQNRRRSPGDIFLPPPFGAAAAGIGGPAPTARQVSPVVAPSSGPRRSSPGYWRRRRLFEQLRSLNAQRLCEPPQCNGRGVGLPKLERTDVGAVNPHALGDGLLR